jgi:hypothetical protein
VGWLPRRLVQGNVAWRDPHHVQGKTISARQKAAFESIAPSAGRLQPIFLDAIVKAYPTFRENMASES